MRTRKTRKRLHNDEIIGNSTQIDFVLKLLDAKLRGTSLQTAIEALNFLGFADSTIIVTGFKTTHARIAFERSPLKKDVSMFAWELCHLTGVTFADEFECIFIGGPPTKRIQFKDDVLTLLVDRLLTAIVVQNRNVLKTVFKMVDKQNQCCIVEV